jgi:hypothetical protein
MDIRNSLAIFPTLILFLAIQIFMPESPGAEEDDVAALQATIKRLELRVKELETLLGVAEGAQRGDAAPSSAGWQNRKNWKRLSAGMKDGEVKGLLGEPSRVIQGVKTLWYYPNLYRGYVTFDENGLLIGWNEP